MLLKIYSDNPSLRQIQAVVKHLDDGGVIIFPTDTVYAIGCDIYKPRSVERVAQMKGIKVEKANFSFIFSDLSHLADFTKPIENQIFKLMKKNLPGPFTFILNANNNIPKMFHSSKRTIGIRIPDNNIPLEIVKQLGHPILSTSVHDDDEIVEYTTDPELIHEKYMKQVDLVIDGGFGDNEPSTIVDCTTGEPVVVREGKGILLL
ncbi:MAG: threonylcarbamoyl-AMP synthase [Bacteroidetes bacterium]|nr:threonylcarbamoyl-AMP synthase [Bacteroidota bacterium]